MDYETERACVTLIALNVKVVHRAGVRYPPDLAYGGSEGAINQGFRVVSTVTHRDVPGKHSHDRDKEVNTLRTAQLDVILRVFADSARSRRGY